MGRTVLIAILILAAFHSAVGQNAPPSSVDFHWLNSDKDAALFERVKMAFSAELKPDDPEKVKPVVAQEHKWISRVGVVETSAFVLIGEPPNAAAVWEHAGKDRGASISNRIDGASTKRDFSAERDWRRKSV
jgi:hypothetical protein